MGKHSKVTFEASKASYLDPGSFPQPARVNSEHPFVDPVFISDGPVE